MVELLRLVVELSPAVHWVVELLRLVVELSPAVHWMVELLRLVVEFQGLSVGHRSKCLRN